MEVPSNITYAPSLFFLNFFKLTVANPLSEDCGDLAVLHPPISSKLARIKEPVRILIIMYCLLSCLSKRHKTNLIFAILVYFSRGCWRVKESHLPHYTDIRFCARLLFCRRP